jgi:hypothetical protein
MNDELQFAYRIRQVLDRGTADMDRDITSRLYELRQGALGRQKVAMAGLSLAGIGHFASTSISGHARGLLAAMALLIGAVGTFYWNNFEQAAANAEIDSALLADEVPFSAYLDQGFMEWLDHLSRQEQSEESSPQ